MALPQEPSGQPRGAGRLTRGPRGLLRGSLLAISLLVASLLLGWAAYASGLHAGTSTPRRESAPPAPAPKEVRLGGHVSGLYPGRLGRLRVHVDNLTQRPLTIRSIGVLVDDANRRCRADNVSVGSYRGKLRLQPRRRRWVPLAISMRPDAASACQNATFPLAYRARVTR
jgi:hypothetical protein